MSRNLSEAAADILNGSFNVAKSKEDKIGSTGFVPKVSTPQQTIKKIGTSGNKTTDPSFNALDGVPTATPPGATPPVGSEPMKKITGQPAQKGTANQPETEKETSDEDKVNRKKATLASVKSQSNPGAVKPCCAEEEEVEEATIEEVMEDLESLEDSVFEDKYGMDKDSARHQIFSENGDDEDETEEEEEELEEATIEEVEADLKKLSDEEFQKKYGVPKAKVAAQIAAAEEKESKSSEQKEKVKEDINAIMAGENLSEEFKEKATTIFEAAVEARVEDITKELQEQYLQEFEETLEAVKSDFSDKLDSYLDYVVENWMEENKLAIEKGLRAEIVEDFITSLKGVFEEHYINIPEDKADIVEQLVDKVEALEDQVNEQILKNIDLKKSIFEHQKEEVIQTVCEGLTLSQAEKVKSLAKNIEFKSAKDFEDKLVSIKEGYFPNETVCANSESLNDSIELDEEATTKVVDPLIEQYANKISRTKF